MFAGRVLKPSLLAATIVAEATAVAEAQLLSHKHEEKPLCRPSELPIYTPEPEPTPERLKQIEAENSPGVIEDTVRSIRQTVFHFSEQVVHLKEVAFDEFEKRQENVESLVQFLREEENTVPRAGAVGIGALAGLIFGLRGGLFKKTLYATTGALGMAAVCYPKEASEYTETGMKEGKKYLTIAYNFIYGVKKDEKPLELPSLPNLPASVGEAWDTIKDKASSFVSDKPAEKKEDAPPSPEGQANK